MELTVAQKNELATRLVNAQQTGNYGSFNDLVKQLRVTQADLLSNFPAINQAGINEQISKGAVVPTSRPAATTFSTTQVANAIRDSLNAGFTVQQARMGAMTNFGLSSEEFDRALTQVQNGQSTFTDERVAQAIRDSLAQGFTLEQARQGAMANYGVSDAQFNRAASMVSGAPQAMRGSAPLYQFPGLLAGREDMATGAQRFLSRVPGSLLFDVPKVEGGQFTFTPGAFDYEAIRNQQAGASKVDTALLEQAQIQPGTAEYNRLTGKTTPQSSTTTTTTPTTTTTTTPTTTAPKTTTPAASSQYTDAQVARAIQESMAQGFSLIDSMAGATRVYGVPVDQVYRAADSLLATKKTPSSAETTSEMRQVQRASASEGPDVGSDVSTEIANLRQQGGPYPAFFGLDNAMIFDRVYGPTAAAPNEVVAGRRSDFASLLPGGGRITSATEPGTQMAIDNLAKAISELKFFESTGNKEMSDMYRRQVGGLLSEYAPVYYSEDQMLGRFAPGTDPAMLARFERELEQQSQLFGGVSREAAIAEAQKNLDFFKNQYQTELNRPQSLNNLYRPGDFDPNQVNYAKVQLDNAMARLRQLEASPTDTAAKIAQIRSQAGDLTLDAARSALGIPIPGVSSFGQQPSSLQQSSLLGSTQVENVAPAVVAPTPPAPAAQANLLAPTTQFSDAQIAQAIIDSLGQGFNINQIQAGALSNFGVEQDQFMRAAGMLPSMGYTIGQGFGQT